MNWRRVAHYALNWPAKLFPQMAQRDDPKGDYKNLLSLRMPVLGADREWHAIHRLHDVGVDTMHGIGFGEKVKSINSHIIYYYRRSHSHN